MPERRIDAISKADALAWNTLHLPKGSSHLLKIISGQLSHMPAGEVMSAVVQKAAKGTFKVTLNGETFIIKGLPASLLGKEVSFIARQIAFSGKGGIDLFWLGQGRAKNAAMHPTAPQARPRVQILSNLPAHLLSHLLSHKQGGKIMSAHIDHIQAGKMAVSISLPDPENPSTSIRYQIQTTAVSHLKPGQDISVRIQPEGNNMALVILPQQKNQTVKSTAIQTAPTLEMASIPLTAGDITAAVVQKRLSNGHIQLNIQGITVETEAPNSIASGDMLTLRMTKAPAEFELISVQKHVAETAMTVVKNNLSVSHEPLTQLITAIRNIMPALLNSDIPAAMQGVNGIGQLEDWLSTSASGQQQPISGDRLASLMRDSGGELEAKLLNLAQQPGQSATQLQDLKSILLQLSGIQNGNIQKSEAIKMLSELSQHGATRIETTQALNVLAHVQGDPIRFELPMLVDQQLVNVQMSMQQQERHTSDGEERGGSKQAFNVLFALELSGLGKMKVDASISDKSVHARIHSSQTAASSFIQENIQRLDTRLHDLGYQDVFLLAAQTPPDADKQRRFDQLTNMAPASFNLLDIIA